MYTKQIFENYIKQILHITITYNLQHREKIEKEETKQIIYWKHTWIESNKLVMTQTAERKGMENALRSMWNHWQIMEIETLRYQKSGQNG